MSADDQHSSFIQTPQQLIVVVLLAFLVPVIGIVLIVQLVTSTPRADPSALTPEAVAARIQPVGQWMPPGATQTAQPAGAPGGAGAPASARSGEQVFKTVCTACHETGVAGAPKIGDKAAWGPRIKQGLQALLHSALNGKNAMPAKGGNPSLSDDEVARAVVYLANHSGASFKEPAAAKPAAQEKTAQEKPQAAAPQQAAASPAKPAAGEGKKIYDSVCMACHMTGVAGAPKLGDKAAWAPRLQQGMDALVQSALKGKGAMPPKGGNPGLPDADVRAAVEFMASQAK